MTGRALESYPEFRTREAVRLMEFVGDFGLGGTERQFVNLGLALDPSRFSLWYGCLHRWGKYLGEIVERGIPILDYDVSSFKHPHSIAGQLRLARDIRRFRIQIVHTHNFYANVFAIPAAKLAGARVVASIRDLGVYLSPQKRRVQRYICSLADQILVNASAIKDWLIAEGYDPRNISVIPNGIDLDRFNQPMASESILSEFGIPADATVVGVVGRVTRFKGIEDFLKAAAIVMSRFPTTHFLVVGEQLFGRGPQRTDEAYKHELKRLAGELGLQNRVVFTGFRSDVERIFAALSVSVQPSLSEGLSNVVLESMSAGLPLVATRVGGTAEAVQDGVNGLLIPPGDPASLASAICRLLSAPALAARLGAAARQSVIDRFSIKQMTATTSAFYESMLHIEPPRPVPAQRMADHPTL